jgi:hypothetical protein
MDASSKMIDLAAFIDRVERTDGADDFRITAFREAFAELTNGNADKARRVLLAFSDPTSQPIEKASGKGAIGAWQPAK